MLKYATENNLRAVSSVRWDLEETEDGCLRVRIYTSLNAESEATLFATLAYRHLTGRLPESETTLPTGWHDAGPGDEDEPEHWRYSWDGLPYSAEVRGPTGIREEMYQVSAWLQMPGEDNRPLHLFGCAPTLPAAFVRAHELLQQLSETKIPELPNA